MNYQGLFFVYPFKIVSNCILFVYSKMATAQNHINVINWHWKRQVCELLFRFKLQLYDNSAMLAISCIIIFSSIRGWSRFIVSQLGYDVKVWNHTELLFHNVVYMTWDYEFKGAVRYLFCHRAVEFGLLIECAVLKPQILSNTIYAGIPY